MKYLIWALVLYFAWRWYLASKEKAARAEAEALRTGAADSARDPARDPASGPAARSAAASSEGAAEKMVGCAHCGIHLPLSEALTGADQRHYCCEEHRALHAAS